ncbi:MAG: hypothetical protein M4579_002674 [Chaenotheca gracillima]|nr:MAG: hypothetical protein M4579_002674 [Chaenotheca gracillima]
MSSSTITNFCAIVTMLATVVMAIMAILSYLWEHKNAEVAKKSKGYSALPCILVAPPPQLRLTEAELDVEIIVATRRLEQSREETLRCLEQMRARERKEKEETGRSSAA